MRKISKSTSRYVVETLDSTRTTHYLSLQEDDKKWWIPDNEDSWNNQMVVTQATALARILRGDILCLPRNQFFDSPGWLSLANYLTKLDLVTFSICLKPGLKPNPDNFISEITNDILRNPKFALSGWPGLSMEERTTIANNIENTSGFSKMFKGIRLDSSTKAFFQEQRDALQSVFDYVKKKRYESDGFNIIDMSFGYQISPWTRLQSDFRSKNFRKKLIERHGETNADEYLRYLRNLIREMPKKAKADAKEAIAKALRESECGLKKINLNFDNLVNSWLNQRTNFYREISDYPLYVRELLRGHINWVYHGALTESLNADGLVAADDGNNKVPYITRQKHLDVIDGDNKRKVKTEDFIALPHSVGINNDTISKLVDELNDEKIREPIRSIRDFRKNKDISKSELAEREEYHLQILSENITSLILDKSSKSWMIDITSNGISKAVSFVGTLAVQGIAAMLINSRSGDVIVGELVKQIGSGAVGNIVNKAGQNLRPAKIQLKNWLNKKDSKIVAGTVRKWLKDAWENNKDSK